MADDKHFYNYDAYRTLSKELEGDDAPNPREVIIDITPPKKTSKIPTLEPDPVDEVLKAAADDPILADILDKNNEHNDRRNGCHLIPVLAIEETQALQEKLRKVNLGLEAIVGLLQPKKVHQVMCEIKFLQDSLYLEPERLKKLDARFAASYVRLSAANMENLGFLEIVEKYILQEMQGTATLIEPVRKTEKWGVFIENVVPKILDASFVGGALALGFGVDLNAIGIAAFGLGGYAGINVLRQCKKLFRLTYSPEDYINPNGPNCYFDLTSCSRQYKDQARGYSMHKDALRTTLVEEAGALLSSLEDTNIKRGCRPEDLYKENILDISRDFLGNVKTIVEGASNYETGLKERERLLGELKKRKEIEEYMRFCVRDKK